MNDKGISVIMPTYNQGAFISRAIASLVCQTFKNWQLIIINDGATDYTDDFVNWYLHDERIKYYHNDHNQGLGAAINRGIDLATHNLIAYLPSDDIYFSNHLESLFNKHLENSASILVHSRLSYEYQDNGFNNSIQESDGMSGELTLQLVQVMHKKTDVRWVERSELVTDNLDELFWAKLLSKGEAIGTGMVTCEWIGHPAQHSKLIDELQGGSIYAYKSYYNVKGPIKFKSNSGTIDEVDIYKKFRGEIKTKVADSLKILIVGELGYNPERIYALEEQGHKLYGLWLNAPFSYNAIGPLGFGNVEDIPYDENWVERVKEIKPDIIYALLNFTAVTLANIVLTSNLGIPFVWHFKESPFYCRQNGIWNELIQLYVNSDGQIYLNPEMKEWFGQFLPPAENSCTFFLDGDLPKKEWFEGQRSPLLSEKDGEIHTVVPGRPYGLKPDDIGHLGKQKIHLHFYGDPHHKVWKWWINAANKLAPGYLHLHTSCIPEDWVKELSQYDAGWMHFFDSKNDGELMKVKWTDINMPARMNTLAAAGLPMLQKDNSGHIVATQALLEKLDIGVFFNSFEDLGDKLRDKKRMEQIRENVWDKRMHFAFDHNVADLIAFFRQVIEKCDREGAINALDETSSII